jgi:uncharacterized protein involved in exopolysaccharide biosynthesis
MEPVSMLDVLRRHILMIAIIGVAATIAGYAFCFLLPTRYTAPALVLVRPQQPIKMGSGKENKEFLDFPMGYASAVETASKTYIQIIKSPALLRTVALQLGLDKQNQHEGGRLSKFLPGFLEGPINTIKHGLRDSVNFLKYGKLIKDDPVQKAVRDLYDNLKMEAHLDTYLFEIKYSAKTPQLAAEVSNTICQKLVEFAKKLSESEATYQRNQLRPEVEQKRKSLDLARRNLERYKQEHRVFLPEEEYTAKLRDISNLELEIVKTEEAAAGGHGTLSTVSSDAKRARLVRLLNERRAELAPLPGIERELKELEERVKDAGVAYEIVQKQYEEADIKRSYAMPEIRVVSAAVPPRLPSSPMRGTITFASLIGGLVVGVGLAFLREYLNRRVRSIQDVEDFVGVKVLATIPRVGRRG